MKEPFIMIAPNGARRGKADHQAFPITIEETVTVAAKCFEAGANGLHLHVRDNDGNHTLDAGRYREALAELAHQVPNMEIQITTEAIGIYDVSAQLDCLRDVKPKWASIAIREINREPDLAKAIYDTCRDNNTKIQHILYDADDARLLENWHEKGIVPEDQKSVLLVLGRYTVGQKSDVATLEPFVAALPEISEWMLCAFGPTEHQCLLKAVELGGNCRVGFENSFVNQDGDPWQDNVTSLTALKSRIQCGCA